MQIPVIQFTELPSCQIQQSEFAPFGIKLMPSSMENPAAFQAYVNAEYIRWSKILQDAKIEKQD